MKKLKALVIGENCDDIFIYGDCVKLNAEAPTPVFIKSKKILMRQVSSQIK